MTRLIYYLILLMLIAAVPATTSVYAQSKSRLDIKPKSTTTQPSQKLGVPFLKPALSDRLVIKRSTAISQFYRSILTSQQTTKKTNSGSELIANTVVSTNEVKANEESLQNVEKLFSNDKITISNFYPNPANEYAMVDYVLSPSVNEAKLVFYNVLGSEVTGYPLEKNERKMTIRTSEIANGIYFYQLYVDGKTLATKKLLVRHQ